jgi:hypothetical protein
MANTRNINLPAGFQLFRGTKISTADNYTRNTPVYFTFGNNGWRAANAAYAKGTNEKVFTFETIKPLKLLRMDTLRGIKYLKNSIKTNKADVITQIDKRFKYDDITKKVIRSSVARHDLMIAKAVCNAGYDGYYSEELFTKYKQSFHPEIVLCGAGTKVKHYGSVKSTGSSPRTPRTPSTPSTPRTPRTPSTPRTPRGFGSGLARKLEM